MNNRTLGTLALRGKLILVMVPMVLSAPPTKTQIPLQEAVEMEQHRQVVAMEQHRQVVAMAQHRQVVVMERLRRVAATAKTQIPLQEAEKMAHLEEVG